MIMVYIFIAFLFANLIYVQSFKNILPDKNTRRWRCPGEECNTENDCVSSVCKCSERFKCSCQITEIKNFNIIVLEGSTNKCNGYLDINEECQHDEFCFSKYCQIIFDKKICLENKRELIRNIQNNNHSPANFSHRPSSDSLNSQGRCKISADCRGPLACYEGICVNWGSQCIGQGECDEGCCEGGYCQKDETVCNKYYSSLTIMIISWIIIGFGLVNCFFWIFWYFIGRSKITSLMSIGGGDIFMTKNVVQGMPITSNEMIQQNHLSNNIQSVNNIPVTNVSKKIVIAKKDNTYEGNYQNINMKSSHIE